MAKTTKKETPKQSAEQAYPKADLLQSAEFTKIERDFLLAYLPDGNHTISDAKKELEKIRKGAVN
ncbi:hypothetical protein [Enterococcus lactis]|uniref:hypothetical protein n=1 Tax=Enterococcus lactis TaxID=357441 RepID=UPI0022E00A2A|nr:hypothetical protein [Enterococcus lactis]